jgi:GH24 family phage-related lysozyme (muramidase)
MDVSATLHKGQSGPLVKNLQLALRANGYVVHSDGVFGVGTELAVRAYQRRASLQADGIAGPRTLAMLGLYTPSHGGFLLKPAAIGVRVGAAAKDKVQDAPPGPSKPAKEWSTSKEGLQFLYVHEAQKHVSNHLHFPGGSSGVTLGPGYDMGGRIAAEVTRDLISLGVPADKAKLAGDGAAGLKGAKAHEFATENKKLIDLTEDQERTLLGKVIPKYEHHVRTNLHVSIFQYQFDALVSFDYNCGGRHKVFHDINAGKVAAAMEEMKKVNTSGGKIVQGLVIRREHEVNLFLHGKYAKSAG